MQAYNSIGVASHYFIRTDVMRSQWHPTKRSGKRVNKDLTMIVNHGQICSHIAELYMLDP